MIDALRAAMREADEVAIAVSFVRASGLQLLLPALSGLRERKAKVRLLTSTYLDVTEPQALLSLSKQSPIELRVQSGSQGFHAKSHLLTLREGQRVGWIGSSNWSLSGLRDNVEWNVRVDDGDAFEEALAAFDGLWRRDDVRAIDEAFIAAYARDRKARNLAGAGEVTGIALRVADTARPTGGYLPTPQPTSLQREALQRLREMRTTGVERAIVVAATGTGKTLLAAFDVLAAGAKQVLFVAHRKDIVTQAAREFARVFGASLPCEVLVEGERSRGQPFVFVTIQTLLAASGAGLRERAFDYVVIDEFHHASAPGWREMLRAIRTRFLLGLTATPERADGHNVMELCDWNVAYEIRLPAAIRGGFLLPFHYFGIADDLVDYQKLLGAGRRRFDEDELGAALSLTERVDLLLRHADEKGYDGPKRVAVAFCAGCARGVHAPRGGAQGRRAEVVHGGTSLDDRARIYAALQDPANALEWLFVADVLNEGVDLPALNTVVFLRPTESPVVFLQQLGRGLRRHESTALLTVLDFVGVHRGAFEALLALHDSSAVPTSRSAEVARSLGVAFTPPEGCEVVLEDQTLKVLEKVRQLTTSRASRVEGVYRDLREELGRPPRPIDLWDRRDVTLADVRTCFGSWRHLRMKMGDAARWEHVVEDEGALDRLLRTAEKNSQQQRVWGYAALWAAADPGRELAEEYGRFFEEHSQWKVEHGKDQLDAGREEIIENLKGLLKKADALDLLEGDGRWSASIASMLQDAVVHDALR
ncbi:MAG: DEAD/DEAH box helicase family protein, partial [Deltaproteobacteria bacterium]|nr:DEAD/DEAH box helicase family protein [Deltaproteobacteria bacterium]